MSRDRWELCPELRFRHPLEPQILGESLGQAFELRCYLHDMGRRPLRRVQRLTLTSAPPRTRGLPG